MKPNISLLTGLTVFLFACASESAPDPDPAVDIETEPAAEMAAAPTFVDEGPDEHVIELPGEIAWGEAPASLERGAEAAVLEGDPSEVGIFTLRIRMPDDYLIAPHWHPGVERVTVLSGNFHLGSGAEVDRTETEVLEAGSYTAIPPETEHYAIAEGETVIQLTSMGPWELNYVNPDDDPR